MPSLTNARHEAFARAIAGGESASDAYRQHVCKGSAKSESVWMAASRLRQIDKVAIRIRELRTALDDTAAWIADKHELLAFHTRAIRTPLSAIDKHSDLCQEQTETATENGATTKLKAVPKIAAAQEIAKLRGYYVQDDAANKGADALAALVATIGGWNAPRWVTPQSEL